MKRKRILVTIIFLFFLMLWILPSNVLGSLIEYHEAEVLSEVREKILKYYVDKISSEVLLKGALQGMLETLDPYCEYLDPEDYQRKLNENDGEFVGIGISMGIRDNVLTVITPIDDSPAMKAGIRAGDKIIMIDKVSTKGMKVSEASKRMRGPKGSYVTLSIIHAGETVAQQIKVIRDTVKATSVENIRILKNNSTIGYCHINQFKRNTSRELKNAIKDLQKQGMKSLIIDLRYNPGGLLDAAIEVVGLFTSGIVLWTQGKESIPSPYFTTSSEKCYNFPLAIIVNDSSASASEVVSGALQDHQRATIVGTRTYGKGLVQSIIPLRDGKSAIKMTTAKYFTPSLHCVQKSKEERGGIVPDVQIDLTEEEEEKLIQNLQFNILSKNDRQVLEAIKVLEKEQALFQDDDVD